MAIVTDRNYRQILSTAMAKRSRSIENLMAENSPLYNAITDRANRRSFDGPEIRHTLQIDKQNAQWFKAYDFLANPPLELFNDAVFTPKSVVVPVSFSGQELRANAGPTRIKNIFRETMDAAEQSMLDELDVAFHGDGTEDGGKSVIGLGGALPIVTNTGTYGGINRADHAIWRTTTFDAATDFPEIVPPGQDPAVDATTIRQIYARATTRRSANGRGADLIVASEEHFWAFEAATVAQQRIVNQNDTGALGFRYLDFVGGGGRARVVLASGINSNMPANTSYGLDTRSLYLYERPGATFTPLFGDGGQMPINQDAVGEYLLWEGELVLANPLYSWRLIDTSVE